MVGSKLEDKTRLKCLFIMVTTVSMGGGKLEDKIEVSVSVSWLSLHARVSALASQQGGGITFEDFSIFCRFR